MGGSNIPYLIYKNLGSSAMVMHSVSNHSLNLPSQTEVNQYLDSLSEYSVSQEGVQCSEPVTVQINNARCVGLLFGKLLCCFCLYHHTVWRICLYMLKVKSSSFQKIVADYHNF